jgi:hypothetical protein
MPQCRWRTRGHDRYQGVRRTPETALQARDDALRAALKIRAIQPKARQKVFKRIGTQTGTDANRTGGLVDAGYKPRRQQWTPEHKESLKG